MTHTLAVAYPLYSTLKKMLNKTFTDNHNSARNTSSVHASTAEIWLPLQGHMGVLSLLFLVMDSTRGSQMFAEAPEQTLLQF